jgi:metal-responsive CopG/Arc/MetJ family transcriptional regulator
MKMWTEIPDHWEDLVDKAKKIEGWKKRSQYFRELIKKDLASKGLLGKNGQIVEHSEDKEVTS